MTPPSRPADPSTPRTALEGIGWLGLFVGLILASNVEWATQFAHAIPDAEASRVGWRADARLILYVLTWVAQNLREPPSVLFSPPVGYPVPGALTGSEHFLGTQPLFLPLLGLSRNPVLAANVTLLLMYATAGALMVVALRDWGLGRWGALAGGIAWASGPLLTPVDLHTVQYAPWAIPAALISLTALRRQPGWRTSAVAAVVLTLALLSSYQVAANMGLLLVVVATMDACAGRWATVWRATGAALVAGAVLAVVSVPYLARVADVGIPPTVGTDTARRAEEVMWWACITESVAPLLVLLALPSLWQLRPSATPSRRRAAATGVVLIGVGITFALGRTLTVGAGSIPLPYALLASTPLHAVVAPPRFLLLVGVGLAFCVGVTVDMLADAQRAGWARALGIGCVVLVLMHALPGWRAPQVSALPTPSTLPQIYGLLARADAANAQPGSVLEIPKATGSTGGMLGVAQAMYLSLLHGRPLVQIHTKGIPPGAVLIGATSSGPLTSERLRALVDMTGLRWIVVHRDPGDPEPALPREALRAASVDDTTLYRVALERTPGWFEALREGPRPGRSLLGTPLALAEAPKGRVTLRRPLPTTTAAGARVPVLLEVRNEGTAGWPVALAPAEDPARAVRVIARWTGRDASIQDIRLPWDVAPGASVTVATSVEAPHKPGAHVLQLALAHEDARYPLADPPWVGLIVQ